MIEKKLQDKVITRASELISFPSETPFGENKEEKFKACADALDYLENILKEMGAETKRMTFEGGHEKWDYAVENLYAEIEIGKYNKKDPFLVYMGHIDVVPVGDEKLWTYPPFKATQENGYIYGRGATDMKSSVSTFITSIEEIIKEQALANNNCKIGFIITADEEWAAVNGSKKVLEYIKEQKMNPTAFIVGEPSSPDYLQDFIKVGRRGSLIGSVTVDGIQGHRAYKELYLNPNRALNFAIMILNDLRWNDGNEFLPSTDFEVVSIASGSENATAVIPAQAKAVFGIRYTDRTTKHELEKLLNDYLKNVPKEYQNHKDYHHYKEMYEKGNVNLVCNLSTASIPYFSEPASLAQSAKEVMHNTLGKNPTLDSSGGTTDARFVHSYFPNAQIIELGVPEKGGVVGDMPNNYGTKGGMHQIDESVAVEDLLNLFEIYKQTTINYIKKENNNG
tara:strand:- start:2007 stop:3359 length:1353 start_codon:yes stop_codon:yes gene_type:complete